MKKLQNLSNVKRRYKHKNVIKDKLFKPWRSLSHVALYPNSGLITLPHGADLAILKDMPQNLLVMYFYSANLVFCCTINLIDVYALNFYKTARTVAVSYSYRAKFFDLGFAHICKLLRLFGTMFLLRVRVKGRLYRIYKRNKYRDLQYRFGHTHLVTVFIDGFYAKYIKKKQIRLFGYDFDGLTAKGCEIRSQYPLGLYTIRGIRIGGNRLFNKVGKSVKFI